MPSPWHLNVPKSYEPTPLLQCIDPHIEYTIEINQITGKATAIYQSIRFSIEHTERV